MERVRIAPEYSKQYLEIDRPQPLCDEYLESLFTDTVTGFGGNKPDHSLEIHETFKKKATAWIFGSELNSLTGIETFNRTDLIIGCTQFIDNLYMQGPIQSIRGDYKYHERLNIGNITEIGNLIPNIPLIIAMPFPSIGAPHTNMEEIFDECERKNIPVHIDGAWITCCRSVSFDFNRPCVVSVGISLSKGLGLGWNRIGLRWSKQTGHDSITIMNDFHMQCRSLSMIGNYILDNVSKDYLWKNYGHLNSKICSDFNLTPTKAIHMAFDENNRYVGLSPLIRKLMQHE